LGRLLSGAGRFLLYSLHVNGAFLQESGKCADRGENGRQHCPHNSGGEREFGYDAVSLLDHHSSHVPFVDEFLDGVEKFTPLNFDCFPKGAFWH
jgi:hypothetical protein